MDLKKAVVEVPKISITSDSKIDIYISRLHQVKESEHIDLRTAQNIGVIDGEMVSWNGHEYLVHFEKINKPDSVFLEVRLNFTDELQSYYRLTSLN